MCVYIHIKALQSGTDRLGNLTMSPAPLISAAFILVLLKLRRSCFSDSAQCVIVTWSREEHTDTPWGSSMPLFN